MAKQSFTIIIDSGKKLGIHIDGKLAGTINGGGMHLEHGVRAKRIRAVTDTEGPAMLASKAASDSGGGAIDFEYTSDPPVKDPPGA